MEQTARPPWTGETCLSWDPRRILPRVTCSVLAVYANRDVQVPALENLEAARALLGRLGKTGWELREIAGMNHAFQHCVTGMPDEYASIDHVMAAEVLGEVESWIASRA